MPRRFTRLPAGAAKHLEAMAEAGMLSELAAATALGMPLDQFQEVLEIHDPSHRIWQRALSIERDNLLRALYSKAVGGDVNALSKLLAIRHGLTEKEPGGGGGVTVNFSLPSAMSPQDYLDAITVKPEALANDTDG